MSSATNDAASIIIIVVRCRNMADVGSSETASRKRGWENEWQPRWTLIDIISVENGWGHMHDDQIKPGASLALRYHSYQLAVFSPPTVHLASHGPTMSRENRQPARNPVS